MNPEEKVIATLKAEMVNDITFIPSKGRYNTPDEPYTWNYKAEVSVKAGNVVKEIELECEREHVYATRDKDDNLIESHYIPKNPNLTSRSSEQFDDLVNAGISIDFSEIIAKYTEMLEEAVKHEKEIKKEAEIKRIIKFKEKYKTCWVLTAKDLLAKDKNKVLQNRRDKIKLIPCSEESFVRTEKGHMTFVYRNFRTDVSFYDKKYEWRSAYEDTGKVKDGEKVKEHRSISNGKTKRSVNLMTILLKYIEAVDDFITSREYIIKRRDDEYIKRREFVKLLEGACGRAVTTFKKEEYSRHRGSSSHWTKYTFRLITKLPKGKYDDPVGLRINSDMDTEYKDGKNVEIGRTYSIEGFRGLDLEQFNGILAILLKGKNVLKVTKKLENIENE